MQRGQISLDLLIALVVVIAVVIALTTIVFTYAESNERSTIQQQLQYNADKTASLITTTQGLDDSNYTIQLQISKVYYTDENKLGKSIYPTITNYTDQNMISFSIIMRNQRQDANAYYYKAANTNIVLDNSTPGKVVITHAS